MTTILIVEDDPMIQHIVGDCFARGNCWVLQADDIESAKLCLYETKNIDIVLIDGTLRNGGRGEHIASYIVQEIWPRQRFEQNHITAFVTMAHDPYDVFGASRVYRKRDLVRMLVREKDGCASWINAMKDVARQWLFAPQAVVSAQRSLSPER